MGFSDWWYYTGAITKTLVLIGMTALALLTLTLLAPHVSFLKPIAQRLGLMQTQTIYVPVNHTVYVNRTIYVNQTVVRYINQTVPIYINRSVYVPVGLNESLSAYLNDLFGWGGLRCWIVTFVYDNATPYYSTGSMATIGTMVIPRQLLGEFYQWIQAGPNSTYYYPYGILQILGFPETFIYTTNTSNGLVELEGFSGELFEPNATNAPVVYLFGDWPGTGPIPHFYAAVINNTGGYMVTTPPPWSVNATAVFYYNKTYTVLFFPTVMRGGLIQGVATPFACNWTIIGPVDPSAIMSYPIPYAWTSSEIIAALEGNLTMSHVEHIYQRNNFGFWVWNMNVTTVNASLPYPTN